MFMEKQENYLSFCFENLGKGISLSFLLVIASIGKPLVTVCFSTDRYPKAFAQRYIFRDGTPYFTGQ